MKQQKAMSGKTRSERFHKDDEKLILRETDGIDAHFGNWEINDITTFDIREYLSHLEDNNIAWLFETSQLSVRNEN